jgi:hypothetical protein
VRGDGVDEREVDDRPFMVAVREREWVGVMLLRVWEGDQRFGGDWVINGSMWLSLIFTTPLAWTLEAVLSASGL